LATSGTTATAPSVTTTVANTRLLHIYWGYVNNSTVTPNASDTERYDAWNISINLGYELADRAQAATGATGTSAATWVGSALFGGLAATVALAPAAAASVPTAGFTGTPLSGTEPLAVTFTDSSTNTPTSWAWDFGDGGTSTAQNPTHSYTAAGTYTVALTATNSAGSNTLTRTGYVTVSDQPRPIRINTSQGWRDIADDTSFVSGSGTPTAAVGATGAIYLNTATGLHYGPKAAGAWPGTALPVPAGTPSDATTSAKGVVQLAGDLAGTAAAPQLNLPYSSTPPASPADGQLWVLPADASKGVMWMFRYRAGSSSSYKWELVGGVPLYLEVLTNDALGANNVWVVDVNALTAPRAGEYRVSYGFYCSSSAAAAIYGGVLVSAQTSPGAATQTGATVSQSGVLANAAKAEVPLTLAAADTVHLAYQASTTTSVGNRYVTLRPVRIS